MNYGKQSAYPVVWDRERNELEQGLTKREYFAGLAMQGLLTRSDGNPQLGILESKRIADESVVMADELLKALEKPE